MIPAETMKSMPCRMIPALVGYHREICPDSPVRHQDQRNRHQEANTQEHSEEQGILNDLFHVARFLVRQMALRALFSSERTPWRRRSGNQTNDSSYNSLEGPIGGALKHVLNRRRALRAYQSADFSMIFLALRRARATVRRAKWREW
jgi:hypothetical protein